MHLVRNDGCQRFICCSSEWILEQMYQSSALTNDMNLFFRKIQFTLSLYYLFLTTKYQRGRFLQTSNRVNGKECVYYEKNYKLVVVVGSTVSPFFTEVDEIHTSVRLGTIALYGRQGEPVQQPAFLFAVSKKEECVYTPLTPVTSPML